MAASGVGWGRNIPRRTATLDNWHPCVNHGCAYLLGVRKKRKILGGESQWEY